MYLHREVKTREKIQSVKCFYEWTTLKLTVLPSLSFQPSSSQPINRVAYYLNPWSPSQKATRLFPRQYSCSNIPKIQAEKSIAVIASSILLFHLVFRKAMWFVLIFSIVLHESIPHTKSFNYLHSFSFNPLLFTIFITCFFKQTFVRLL